MTQERIADIIFVFLTFIAVMGWAIKTSAGVPGPQQNAPIMIEQRVTEDNGMANLSPVEIRNAMSIRLDRLEARGINVRSPRH
jgi:hypothetical protein